MKRIILMISLSAICFGSGAMAQSVSAFVPEVDETITGVIVFGSPTDEGIKQRSSAAMAATVRRSPQQVGVPRFVFADKSGRASFAIGGFVNFRTAYDFNQVVDNRDFVTYDIPMCASPMNKQRILMDASTSRLYFKALINTGCGDALQAYIETDFRGPGNNLRLREAYVSYRGFLAGQTVTTFCDLAASPNTIDFEGPNGYTYGRNMMLRYSRQYASGVSWALALEYPSVSATEGTQAKLVPQRIPDVPIYIQYAWNQKRSHIRASAIMRNMYYHDIVANKTRDEIGWGVQGSASLYLSRTFSLCGQYLYGNGVANYIQDLQGTGNALVPDVDHAGRLSAPTTTAWLAGAQINIVPRMPLTLAYSQVKLTDSHGSLDANHYKKGDYIVANVFYNFTSWLNVGVEYLYGTRRNHNNELGQANRIQTAVQVSF